MSSEALVEPEGVWGPLKDIGGCSFVRGHSCPQRAHHWFLLALFSSRSDAGWSGYPRRGPQPKFLELIPYVSPESTLAPMMPPLLSRTYKRL